MIYIFLTNNFELVEAMTPIDMLRRAKIDICTVSITGKADVNSSSNVIVTAERLFDDCDFKDIQGVILPGGPGTSSLKAHSGLCNLVLENYRKGNLTAAICAAPTLLADIEIKEKTAVFPALSDKVYNYSDERVCIDGNVITAAAMGCSAEFAYEIIKYIKGEDTARDVAGSILMKL